LSSLQEKYSHLIQLLDKEFDRNIDLHKEKIKCCKGCSKCCYQIFRISNFDAEIIREYLNREDNSALKMNLKKKADEYLKNNNSIKSCPALNEEGACMIYPARPVICRRFGPPVYDYKNPGKLHACELNFADGEEINDPGLIEKQKEIGILWDEIKTSFNEDKKYDENISTTIAEAILHS
jgi:Fe-S-cluster containining protein